MKSRALWARRLFDKPKDSESCLFCLQSGGSVWSALLLYGTAQGKRQKDALRTHCDTQGMKKWE